MREEIEIEIGNSIGSQFTGTLTMVEAKHGIYIQIQTSAKAMHILILFSLTLLFK